MTTGWQDFVEQLEAAFRGFDRPGSIVVHAPDDCIDCQSVVGVLSGETCGSLMKADKPIFSSIPVDCLNAPAFLHYFPAISAEAFGPNGKHLAETIAWILGVDEENWDTDQTISMQIWPFLNASQREHMREFLHRLEGLELPGVSLDYLAAAREFWKADSPSAV